jgi:hypothetical protein
MKSSLVLWGVALFSSALYGAQLFQIDDFSTEGVVVLISTNAQGVVTRSFFPENTQVIFQYDDLIPAAVNSVTYINLIETYFDPAEGTPIGSISDTFEHILTQGQSLERVCFSSDPASPCALLNPPVTPQPVNMNETSQNFLTVRTVTDQNNNILTTYQIASDVPEPGTLFTLGVGLLTCFWLRRARLFTR